MSANDTTKLAAPVEDADNAGRVRELLDDVKWPSDDELEHISDHSGLSMV